MTTPKTITLAIQARIGSTRLPKKALRQLREMTLFECIVRQLKGARAVQRLALSTSNKPEERPLVDLASSLGLSVHVGPVDDIVTRLWTAADETNCDVLVRVWGDCAFLCPDVIDEMVGYFLENDLEFLNNENFPGGLDVEIYSKDLLRRMNKDVSDPKEREFPVEYVKRNAVKRASYEPKEKLSNVHLTIDYPEDLSAAETLYAQLWQSNRPFNYRDLIDLFKAKPELVGLFSQRARNIEYNDYLLKRGAK